MAKKLSGGSTSNTKDNSGRRLGVKKFGGEFVRSGNIICKQRGTKNYPGRGTYLSSDHSIHAKIDGYVKFVKKTKLNSNQKIQQITVINNTN